MSDSESDYGNNPSESSEGEESDFIEDDLSDAAAKPKKKKAATTKTTTGVKKPTAAAKKKPAAKSKIQDDDSDEEDLPVKAKKAPPKKRSKKTPAAAVVAEDKEDAEEAEEEISKDDEQDTSTTSATAASPKKGGGGGGKGQTVEELYQKLTQLEHVLKRPDTYVGSVERHDEDAIWLWNEATSTMVQRKASFVPALYKIFDEILVNAADNKQRDPEGMDTIKVTIEPATAKLSVWNNGKGIPVEMHKKENVFVPELIFGHLLTGSNYRDDVKKVTGGRNGFGAKLCNIFSKEFTVETCDGIKTYTQTWSDNMSQISKPKIKDTADSKPFTCIKFRPDLSKFGMDDEKGLDEDIVALMRKRVYDVAGCNASNGLKVFLDGKRLSIKSFKDYVSLYLKPAPTSESTSMDTSVEAPTAAAAAAVAPLLNSGQFVIERLNKRWEVAVAMSDGEFQQVSFVNSICTTRGGTHVKAVTDALTTFLLEKNNGKASTTSAKKKNASTQLKPAQIRNHLWVFVNALVENPAFDSQTKDTLTTKSSSFGSKPEMEEGFLKKVFKLGILNMVLTMAAAKADALLMKKGGGSRRARIQGMAKLDDANNAGTRKGGLCTLILTEGDSAKSLALSGMTVVGRDNYGVFPLRGKVLNVRDATSKQVMDNEELKNVCKAMGLQYGKAYTSIDQLRYGHLMIMTDQDYDGSHIKGLLINFIHTYWPSLLKIPGFLVEFITPVIKAIKGKEEISFFTVPQYNMWKETPAGQTKGWHIKYYKGLGTSTSAEGKEYFNNIDKHQIDFEYTGPTCDAAIDLAFSKKKADARKQWMKDFKPGTFLDQDVESVTITDFVHKELILFSLEDCERSIPSFIDGFKPAQRKILYAAFKKNMTKEMKVYEMSGIVSSVSAYHHGETSMHETIIGMAQNYVGGNNINLLYPAGQFGSRRQGGKDHASARYIHTRLSDITRQLFQQADDPVLEYLEDDGKPIEPKWYIPLIPMSLVNGASGIGTGWATNIPCYNPREVVENVKRVMAGVSMQPMQPWYRGWKGKLVLDEKTKNYKSFGVWNRVSETTIEITELPLMTWTQNYKEFLEELMTVPVTAAEKKDNKKKKQQQEEQENGGTTDEEAEKEKKKKERKERREEAIVKDYKEYHGEETVHFVVELMKELPDEEIPKVFKLSSSVNVNNIVAFDEEGRITHFPKGPEDILPRFVKLRMEMYQKRKDNQIKTITEQFNVMSNKARFIKAVLDKKLKIRGLKRAEVLEQLVAQKFDPYPKNSKDAKKKKEEEEEEEERGEQQEKEEDEAEKENKKSDYDYLLSMALWSLTKEKAEQLMKQVEEKKAELEKLKATTLECMYQRELDEFLSKLDEWEERQEQELTKGDKTKKVKLITKKKGGRKGTGAASKPKSRVKKEEEDDSDVFEDSKTAKKKEPAVKKAPVTLKPGVIAAAVAAVAVAPVKQPAASSASLPPSASTTPAEGGAATGVSTMLSPSPEKKERPKRGGAVGATAAGSSKKPVYIEESSDEEKEEDLATRMKKRAAEEVKKKPTTVEEKKEEVMKKEEEEEESDSTSKKRKKPAATTKRATTTKKKAAVVELSDDEEEEEEEEKKKPKRKPAAKKPTAAPAGGRKRKQVIEDDDEEEEEDDEDEEIELEDDDDSDEDEVAPPPPTANKRPTRAAAKQAATHLVESDDEVDLFDEDDD